jgi:hypothetical protein
LVLLSVNTTSLILKLMEVSWQWELPIKTIICHLIIDIYQFPRMYTVILGWGEWWIGKHWKIAVLFLAHSQIAENDVNFVMSVFPSVHMKQLGFHWTDFNEILYLRGFSKTCWEYPSIIKIRGRIRGTLHANLRTRGAGKSLARAGRKQATAIEDFDFHISYL